MTSGSGIVDDEAEFGLIGLTPRGIIESWNLGAQRLTGYTSEEAVGHSLSMFYSPEDQSIGLHDSYLREARLNGTAVQSGWRLRKNGSQFWADTRITALHAPSGTLIGYANVVLDLTERMRENAAQANYYGEFMHDFLVPITAIKGFTELIQDENPSNQHFLDRVDSNADRMLAMAEELIEHAKDRSAHLTIKLEAIDLAVLARHVAVNLITDTARITVTDDKVMVMADPATLHRVIANVLNNAIKYSNPDSVIAFTTEESATEGILRVTDSGRGIDSNDLETVFLEFQRGRLARSDGGSGLGLASARQLVDKLGGTMRIESEVDVGTTVVISIPKQLAAVDDEPAI